MTPEVQIEESWKEILKDEFKKDYFLTLISFVKNAYKRGLCYPPGPQIFEAFNRCSFTDTKVVIIGQDPYHGAGQAHGLCFSVNDGVPHPPSLKNIFKELKENVGIEIPVNGNLTRWASQGVLLLNATLTVEANMAGSHQGQGWEKFTDGVIEQLNSNKENIVFMLWGSYAQNKGKFIDTNRHLVLRAAHPSPLAANRGGWFGTKHFSQCNEYLKNKEKKPIIW